MVRIEVDSNTFIVHEILIYQFSLTRAIAAIWNDTCYCYWKNKMFNQKRKAVFSLNRNKYFHS